MTSGRRDRIRITYILDSLGQGGAERSLLEIIAALEATVAADLVVLRQRPDLRPQADRQGLRVTTLSSSSRLHAIGALTRHLRRELPDLVHTTLFEANVAGRTAARVAGIPVVSSLVSTPYGPSHLGEPGLSKHRVRAAQAAEAFTARFVRRFHANAEHVAVTMAQRLRLDPGRIDVIPRGRDAAALGTRTSERSHRARAQLGVADRPVLLAVGREEHLKGVDVLLHALAASANTVQLLVAGRSGNATDDLRHLVARLHLEEQVRFLGFREDIPELLAAADVLVLPSRREGFPGILLEAMALETPIVASDLPGVREVVGGSDVAWLVPVDDTSSLASALDAVLADRVSARARAARGRARFLDQFTIDRTAELMLGFYRRALSRDHRRG